MSELDKICNKLGGIPVFDTFIEDFYESDKNKKNKNFMKPEEDLDNTYVWMIYRDMGIPSSYNNFIQTICPPSRGWSCAGRENQLCYFRRPRNIIIPPMGPPNYTPPETSEDDEEIGHEFDEQGILLWKIYREFINVNSSVLFEIHYVYLYHYVGVRSNITDLLYKTILSIFRYIKLKL